MEITDVKVRKINQEGKMRGIVSVTFDNAFVVHDIKVIEASGKLFVAMPSRRTADGEYKDVAHPINAETREKLHKRVLEEYNEELKRVAI